ncbi:MAG: FAD:protein FMN transferase [Halioglobus sp.]|nr:FAD:protein FMN transferase [Halioglobus sp.]
MVRVEHNFKAMGGPCSLRVDTDDKAAANMAVKAAVAEVARLERKYSRYLNGSLTNRINRAAGEGLPVPIDAETSALLSYADTAWRESEGLFDLTSGVLRFAWDFKSDRCPEQCEIDALLPLVGWDLVRREQDSVYLPMAGMELDFGGCVKEYAADSAAMQLRRYGVTSALIDLAGDMVAVGAPQGVATGTAGWPVGIRHPLQKDRAVAGVHMPEGGLASSGDYERCLLVDGKRYGHILHPHTGWPVRGLIAVSVLAEQCLVAGSSATIAMLKPVDEALKWLDGLGVPWLAVDANLNCHGSLALSQHAGKRE